MTAIPEHQESSGHSSKAHLTPDQQKALAIDRNISVTAGAGSGKTTLLVERYLRIILEEKAKIREVLAITFTEKAAAEMLERVAENIERRLTTITAVNERRKLLQLREQLNSAQISTIHSFCTRLLREFPVASGVDPDFSVLSEFPQSIFMDEAIDEVLHQLDQLTLESEYRREEWKELLRQIPPGQLRLILKELLLHPYEVQYFREKLESHDDDALFNALCQNFLQLVNQVLGETFLPQTLTIISELKAITKPDNLKPKGEALFSCIHQFPGSEDELTIWSHIFLLSELSTTSNGQAYKSWSTFGKFDPAVIQLLDKLSALMVQVSAFKKEVVATIPGRSDRHLIHNLRMIFELEHLVRQVYEAKKEERGMLDFEDLQMRVLEMLRSREDVRNTLRNRYRYIMVDEFQDTNFLQWELISLMGTQEGELEEAKFFVVGDPKQSIYGFRNADVRVFQEVKRQFAANPDPSGEKNIVFRESFRFLPSVNRFINVLFGKILQEEQSNPFSVGYDALDTRRTHLEDIGEIELAFLNQEKLKDNQFTQEDYIALKIAELLEEETEIYRKSGRSEERRRIRPGDIAILIPRRTKLLDLEVKLRKYGVPFKTIGGMGFYRRQEIQDVYHLLRALVNPTDNVALVAILRSPFVGLSDAGLFYLSLEEGSNYYEKVMNIKDFSNYREADQKALKLFQKQFTHWINRRDRLSLSRLLVEIFEDSFYRATLAATWEGQRLLANLDKIIEEARDYEQSGFIAMYDFIQSLSEQIQQDPREGEAQLTLEEANAVKIMTIHQAKGLEFPVVFCPYLNQSVQNARNSVLFDSDFGIGIKLNDPENDYQQTSTFTYDQIRFRKKQQALAELRRLFYVAVTRARDRVYLIGEASSRSVNSANPLSWTMNALNLDLDDEGEIILDDKLTIRLTTEISSKIPEHHPSSSTTEEKIQEFTTYVSQFLTTSPSEHSSLPTSRIPAHLQPVQSIPEGIVFSATQLAVFHEDPRKYFQRYHLGFFESDYEFIHPIGEADQLHLLKGKLVHAVLENGLPQSVADIAFRLDHAFHRYEVFDPKMKSELEEEITGMLATFIKSEAAREIFENPLAKTEIPITMRLGKDYFTGTLDRVFKNSEGLWEVVDYKTNKVSASQVENEGKKYTLQLEGYGLLLANLFPEQSEYPVTLYFLHPGAHYRRVFQPADIEAIREKFLSLIREIRTLYPLGDKIL